MEITDLFLKYHGGISEICGGKKWDDSRFSLSTSAFLCQILIPSVLHKCHLGLVIYAAVRRDSFSHGCYNC
jgi:hypothetical protein